MGGGPPPVEILQDAGPVASVFGNASSGAAAAAAGDRTSFCLELRPVRRLLRPPLLGAPWLPFTFTAFGEDISSLSEAVKGEIFSIFSPTRSLSSELRSISPDLHKGAPGFFDEEEAVKSAPSHQSK